MKFYCFQRKTKLNLEILFIKQQIKFYEKTKSSNLKLKN